jgi:hypothetical protein
MPPSPLAPARGCVYAVLLGAAGWIVVGLVVYGVWRYWL